MLLFSPARLVRALGFLCLLAPSLHAQTGRVVGTLTDARDGTPLIGADVRLGGTRLGAATDIDGRFEIASVPAGAYTLTARLVGYDPASQSVIVATGATARVDLRLSPGRSLGEAVVEGRAADLVGIADAASQGRVGQAEIEARPLQRVGEVLETVPGLIVTQHSGSGKANQFFLRGFNLDHGTDFSTSIEGVPFNLPTHAHGQGWLDLNSLVPELIEVIAFQKGPYHADRGDFSTAGSAQIQLARRLDTSIARAEGGTDEYGRVLLASSSRLGGGDLLLAANGQYYNGPWDNPENSGLFSGVAKFSHGTDARGTSVTALGYHNTWNSSDQIARRAVDDGLITRFGALDPSDGGRTSRYTLAANAWRTTGPGARTEATAYAAYYDLNLFSNFTYRLDDPVRGDQFEQADRRVYGGAHISHVQPVPVFGRPNEVTVGANVRHDQILQVGLFHTEARQRIGTTRDDDVAETAGGAFVQTETRWMPRVRTTLGLRADAFRFDVSSDTPAGDGAANALNSGVATDALVSPSAGLALGPWRSTELYLNGGLGFHSNDARGTTIAVDPLTGDPVDRVSPLVRTTGAEVGVRTTALRGLQSTVALWTIGLGSELVFVGDAGGTEASGATRHYGVEWANYYRATDWLAADLDLAFTESHYTEDEGEGTEIENSIGRTINGGIALGRETGGPLGALRLRHFGPRPLTGDGSVQSESTTLVNVQAGYRFRRVAVALDVLNLLGSKDPDVSYFYASRLPGEPAAGVEDVHFHPVLPRTARLQITARF